MENKQKIINAWRSIYSALKNYGLDFFLQDEIDLIVSTIKKAIGE